MTKSAHPERETQNRIVTFFQKELGYKYLGNLEDSENCNVRWGDWKKFLYDSGFSVDFVDAIQTNFYQILSDFSQSPYHTNKEVYRILKYGLKLAEHPGQSPKTVYFINWEEPEKNNFYIAEACRYYEIFQEKNFKNCAIVSSYKPNRGELRTDFSSTTEDSENWKKQKAYLKMLGYDPDVSVEDDDLYKKIEAFEKRVKDMFVDEPANMQLLIVVDKLLTGFDAPPCTYLYIDKPMHDHGLFQAICRVNRLDGDDKEFGYVVDYKELFGDLKDAVNSYTGNALSGFDEEDISGLLKNKLEEGKKRFEFLLQELETLTDDVEYPRDQLAFKHFFCGESGTVDPDNDHDFAKLRSKMYKLVSSLARAYADLKPAFDDVGYSKEEQEKYNRLVKEYVDLKDEIGLSSGDFIDLKQYDSAMRHLIDNYISASDSEKLGDMENFTLLAYIQKKQEEDLKNGNSESDKKHKPAQQNVAETIENNIRRKIIEKTPVNPKYYQKMSELFQTLIDERKEEVASYKEMLEKYAGLVIQVEKPE